MTQENVDEIRELFCKNCETKELYHLSLKAIKQLLSENEEMAYLLWKQSEAIGERKWWKHARREAVIKMAKFKMDIPSRPDIEVEQ